MDHAGSRLQGRLAGGLSDREELIRIYRRRAQRDVKIPAGTAELVHQLEREPDSRVVLFAITDGPEVIYVFARNDLSSLIGCIAGERP